MRYLRFENKSAALAEFDPWIIKDQFPSYIGTVAVGEVGTVHKPTGEVINTTEGHVPVTAPVAGYWVYLSDRVPELQAFEVAEPEHIAWVFAGSAPDAPPPVPSEVPRYCGVLALKRHRLADDELQQLDEEEGWESGSLYAQLLAFRDDLPSGALRDKLDIAIDHVMHWTLESPTVAEMCAVMGLSTTHRDALFRWAKAHEATL